MCVYAQWTRDYVCWSEHWTVISGATSQRNPPYDPYVKSCHVFSVKCKQYPGPYEILFDENKSTKTHSQSYKTNAVRIVSVPLCRSGSSWMWVHEASAENRMRYYSDLREWEKQTCVTLCLTLGSSAGTGRSVNSFEMWMKAPKLQSVWNENHTNADGKWSPVQSSGTRCADKLITIILITFEHFNDVFHYLSN